MLALSGGVDSSVLALLLQKALGERVHPIFVDTGFLRASDRFFVEKILGEALNLRVHTVEAEKDFFAALRGVSDPEEKRGA